MGLRWVAFVIRTAPVPEKCLIPASITPILMYATRLVGVLAPGSSVMSIQQFFKSLPAIASTPWEMWKGHKIINLLRNAGLTGTAKATQSVRSRLVRVLRLAVVSVL